MYAQHGILLGGPVKNEGQRLRPKIVGDSVLGWGKREEGHPTWRAALFQQLAVYAPKAPCISTCAGTVVSTG